jgi:peptidoglycan/xylan/chitin deacetylase (PgdA/CDA1 family)
MTRRVPPRPPAAPGLVPAPAARPSTSATAILMYHSIATHTTSGFGGLTVDPARFAEHVAALRDAGVRLVTADAAAGGLAAPDPTDRRPTVAITIDDALADAASGAAPALADHGVPATLFVPTAYVGGHAGWLRGVDAQRPLLDWSAIAQLADAGWEIGSHGHRHLACDVNRPDVVRADAAHSRVLLEDRLGRAVHSFGFPFGYGPPAARRAIRAAGFAQACVVADLPAEPQDDRFALPRLHVGPEMTPERLVALVQRRAGAPRRAWALGKQRVWTAGRRWAGWGPPEAGVVRLDRSVSA